MFAYATSFRSLGHVVLILALFGVMQSGRASGAPAPKPKPYALLYIPKKTSLHETNLYRRKQIALLRTDTPPYVLHWAIDSLKNSDLPSLPKKGKGGKNKDDHAEDVAWLERHLQIEYLDGTGVLRIALDAGTPREQALLVNAVLHSYFRLRVQPPQKRSEMHLEGLQKQLKADKEVSAVSKGEDKDNIEHSIRKTEESIKRFKEELQTLPRLLELADVPAE